MILTEVSTEIEGTRKITTGVVSLKSGVSDLVCVKRPLSIELERISSRHQFETMVLFKVVTPEGRDFYWVNFRGFLHLFL